MTYNIRPELTAIPFLIVLYVYFLMRYRTQSEMRIIYRRLVFCVLCGCVTDAWLFYLIGDTALPFTLALGAVTGYFFLRYTLRYLDNRGSGWFAAFLWISFIAGIVAELTVLNRVRFVWAMAALILYIALLMMEMPVMIRSGQTEHSIQDSDTEIEEAIIKTLAAVNAKTVFLEHVSREIEEPMNELLALYGKLLEDDRGILQDEQRRMIREALTEMSLTTQAFVIYAKDRKETDLASGGGWWKP